MEVLRLPKRKDTITAVYAYAIGDTAMHPLVLSKISHVSETKKSITLPKKNLCRMAGV